MFLLGVAFECLMFLNSFWGGPCLVDFGFFSLGYRAGFWCGLSF